MSQEYEVRNGNFVLKNVTLNRHIYDGKIFSLRQDISSLVETIIQLLGGDILDNPTEDFELTREQLSVRYILYIYVDFS